jgi:hypothetical protein
LFGTFNVNFSGFNTPATTFSASGAGSAVAGVNIPRPLGMSGGTLINLSGSAFLEEGDFSPSSSVTINGVAYGIHIVDVSMTSTAVTIPFSTASTLALTAPCTVTGSVTGTKSAVTASAGFNGLCNATLNLTRGGTDAQGNGLYNFQSINYGFRAVPTPEPATLLLISIGLGGITAYTIRRKRLKDRTPD